MTIGTSKADMICNVLSKLSQSRLHTIHIASTLTGLQLISQEGCKNTHGRTASSGGDIHIPMNLSVT